MAEIGKPVREEPWQVPAPEKEPIQEPAAPPAPAPEKEPEEVPA
jgi:hypothetical protein